MKKNKQAILDSCIQFLMHQNTKLEHIKCLCMLCMYMKWTYIYVSVVHMHTFVWHGFTLWSGHPVLSHCHMQMVLKYLKFKIQFMCNKMRKVSNLALITQSKSYTEWYTALPIRINAGLWNCSILFYRNS